MPLFYWMPPKDKGALSSNSQQIGLAHFGNSHLRFITVNETVRVWGHKKRKGHAQGTRGISSLLASWFLHHFHPQCHPTNKHNSSLSDKSVSVRSYYCTDYNLCWLHMLTQASLLLSCIGVRRAGLDWGTEVNSIGNLIFFSLSVLANMYVTFSKLPLCLQHRWHQLWLDFFSYFLVSF